MTENPKRAAPRVDPPGLDGAGQADRAHATAENRVRASTVRDHHSGGGARRWVRHQPDEHGARGPPAHQRVHRWPPGTRLQTHPTPAAALPHRRGGPNQPPQTLLRLDRSRLKGGEGRQIWTEWAILAITPTRSPSGSGERLPIAPSTRANPFTRNGRARLRGRFVSQEFFRGKLQTARSLRPASHPTSRSRTGASLPGTQASPRTGLAPAGHRELIAPTSCGPPCPHGARAVPAHPLKAQARDPAARGVKAQVTAQTIRRVLARAGTTT